MRLEGVHGARETAVSTPLHRSHFDNGSKRETDFRSSFHVALNRIDQTQERLVEGLGPLCMRDVTSAGDLDTS